MSDSWTTHFKGTVGGRPVEVKTYDDGGDLLVVTNHGRDHDPVDLSDEDSIALIPPTSKDDPLEIHGDALDELLPELVKAGFSSSDAEQIISHFPA